MIQNSLGPQSNAVIFCSSALEECNVLWISFLCLMTGLIEMSSVNVIN
jgi:hypothetical protein